jgi:hypothetical protein
MTNPVAHQEVAAITRESAEMIVQARQRRAQHLSGMPRPGRTFGIGRWLQSGSKRSGRLVIENGALRSDAAA